MKVICTQENLKAGLQTVGRIISPSNSLPILNNILIKTENGMLKISATNLEVAVTTQIRCKVEEEGEVTVFSKTIIDLVNNLPNKNIILQTDNHELIVETENYHTTIKTLPAEEFPLIPTVEGGVEVGLDAQELKNAVDQVVFAVSTNHTQPELSGVFMNLEGVTMKVVATDRYRLAEKKLVLKKPVKETVQAIVPQKTIAELSRIIAGQTGEVEISFSQTQIAFSFSQTQIISRLIDAQYPDYNPIIPEQFNTIIVTTKQPLMNALRAGGIFSQTTNSIHMDFLPDKQTLTVVSESQDLGKSVVELPSQIQGDSGNVILNHRYVLDCLSCLSNENVIIKIVNDSTAAIIVPENQNDYLYLVMPIKS